MLLLYVSGLRGPVGRSEDHLAEPAEHDRLLMCQPEVLAILYRNPGGVHPVHVIGVPEEAAVAVVVLLHDQSHGHATGLGADHRVGVPGVRHAEHDHVDSDGLARVARHRPHRKILRRREVERWVLREIPYTRCGVLEMFA